MSESYRGPAFDSRPGAARAGLAHLLQSLGLQKNGKQQFVHFELRIIKRKTQIKYISQVELDI